MSRRTPLTPPRRPPIAPNSPHRPEARWKIATGLLAAATAWFALRGPGVGQGDPAGSVDRPGGGRASAGRVAGGRRLRVPGHLVGLDEDQILRELESARSAQRIQALCERLGFVGTDRSVDLLERLVRDPRRGVGQAAADAMGHIGTDQATSALLAFVDGTGRARGAAVSALGLTGQDRARQRLGQIAASRLDPQRIAAIRALGEMGGREAIELLRRLPDRSRAVMETVVQAAAAVGGDEGEAFLLEMAGDAGLHGTIRAAALAALPGTADLDRQAELLELVASGDPHTAAAAASVLGQSGAGPAVPILLDLARTGAAAASASAVFALAEIGSPEAVKGLAELAARGPADLAQLATGAMAQADTPEARALLLAAATTGPSSRRAGALAALAQFGGEEVEGILLQAARTGDLRLRHVALQHLVKLGSPEAAALVVERATSGTRQERQTFLSMVGELDGEVAHEALWGVARGAVGSGRVEALELLLATDPADPEVTSALIESMKNGRSDEANPAANALARSGSVEAQGALLAALTSGDDRLARVAVNATRSMLGDGEVVDALAQAARASTDEEVKEGALAQLLQAGVPEGFQVAQEMVRSGRPGAAYQAMRTVAMVGGGEDSQLAREASRQKEPEVRAMAAAALAAGGDPSSTPVLLQLLRDPDQAVRNAAMNGLSQIGSPEAIGALIQATRAERPDERRLALQGLSYADDPRATTTIAELIRGSDPVLAAEAIAFSSQGDGNVERALVAALRSPHAEVRQAAAVQLRGRGGRLDPAAQRLVDDILNTEAPRPAYPVRP